ncbi:MAG: MFS transporter [Streptosporangiales bacterium]|nr:MFS transporter [Streptosporangiales bacterium]
MMTDMPVSSTRSIAGAILLDLAVSSLFAWDVFVPVLGRELDVSRASLAVTFSVGLVGFTAGVLGGGRLADRVAPRRLAVGTALGAAAGLACAAVASSLLAVVLSFGALLGLATGTGYATAVRVAGAVTTRRGLALGLVVSAYAGGTVVVAPVAAVLLDVVGRAGTLGVLAIGTAATVLVAAMLLPAQAPPRPDPSSRRGPVYSGTTLRLWLAFGLGSAPGLAAFAHAGALAGGPHTAALAVALLSAGNFGGRLVVGPLSDRLSRPVAMHLTAATLVVACVALALTDSRAVSLAALLVLGTQYGALSALTPAAAADRFPTDRLGATYGVVFTSWGLAGLSAPLFAGHAANQLGWHQVYAVFLVPAAVSWLAVAVPSLGLSSPAR